MWRGVWLRSLFSFQALAEDSGLLERGVDDSGARTLGSSSQGSFIDWPWFLALVELADREPQGQYWSMSLVMARGRRFALVSATTAFFTIWTKLPNSWSSFCSSAKMDSRRPFWKYLSIVGLAGAPIESYILLMLRDTLKLILEFLLRYRILDLRVMLLFMPSLNHRPAEKRGGKRDLIWPIGPGRMVRSGKSAFRGCSRGTELAWSWPCSWLLTNDSRANLVAVCRFSSVYLPGGPGAEAGAGVEARETAGVGSGVPLSLVRAPPALRQVQGPTIWTGWVDYTSILPNRLADPLGLELLEL